MTLMARPTFVVEEFVPWVHKSSCRPEQITTEALKQNEQSIDARGYVCQWRVVSYCYTPSRKQACADFRSRFCSGKYPFPHPWRVSRFDDNKQYAT